MSKQMNDTRVDIAPLATFMREHNLTHQGMGNLCKMPSSTISTWLRLHKMPAYMLVVLEGLQRRNRSVATERETLVLIGTKLQLEPFENMARMSNVTVARLTEGD